jgi:hypothetical protein
MGFFDRLLTRGRAAPSFAELPTGVRRRLSPVCNDLGAAEQEMAERLGLPQPPRLLLVDEEAAVILVPEERGKTG